MFRFSVLLHCHLSHRVPPLLAVAIPALLFQLVQTPVAHANSADPPNIVLILADDLGYGDLSGYGSQLIDTPNIDRMMRKGARMTDGYVSAAVCSPRLFAVTT